jgi:ribosomal protein S18 acetylase RimI-like enzyme
LRGAQEAGYDVSEMDLHPLDNPIWAALQTAHAPLSLGNTALKRYPADVVPFAAVALDGVVTAQSLAQVLEDDAPVYFIGRVPLVPSPWVSEPGVDLVQMICLHPSAPGASVRRVDAHRVDAHRVDAHRVDFRELGDVDVGAMLALTDQVFPGYFRKNTVKMGRYYGVFDAGELVAMAGERLAMKGYREVSAVCTHPAYAGRGYASVLVRHVVDSILDRKDTPFLHVSPENQRARALYRTLGFTERGTVPWAHVSRSV